MLSQPTRHNPYLHELVLNQLKQEKPGHVLDIPSGPGYLLRDLQKMGYTGVAAEIDESLHVFQDIKYVKVDMIGRFPFEDSSFDYVLSIEGIEHIENHFAFLREVRRVLKPGGKLILTTPNVASVGSRWQFFISGFHNLAAKPIPLDSENMYFEHINPITFSHLFFICTRVGLKIQNLLTYRYEKGARLYYYLFYPFIRFGVYRACFLKEKESARKELNTQLYHWLISKENLLGSHTIIVAQKELNR